MEDAFATQPDGALDHENDTHPKDPSTNEMTKSPKLPSGKQNGHKRSFSGSILSRFTFLRTASDDVKSSTSAIDTTDGADDEDYAGTPTSESAMASAQRMAKGRKRKGSLRKTALLGTGKIKTEVRERRNSLLQRKPSAKLVNASNTASPIPTSPDTVVLGSPTSADLDFQADRPALGSDVRKMSYEHPTATSSSEDGWAGVARQLSLDMTVPSQPISINSNAAILASPIKSPTSQSYASTTDEDEALTFSRPSNGHLHQPAPKSPVSSSSSSYFPSPPLITRRRSTKTNGALSPLSALPLDALAPDEEHDYSETEWWGWVVLIVTWLVFTIGMGSCLDIWSWAWDVGQTPYAPPELEDDPTLPIVGYYPALIILTAVMAWVWVVVAWVGMKYFKHAKIQGDDT